MKNKVIVVTGAAGLLGRKHVEAIATYGGTPILLDLAEKKNDELVKEINSKHKVNAEGFVADITDEKRIKDISNEIIKRFGKLDGLVNNAANNPKIEKNTKINFTRLENFSIDAWYQDLAVGLTGSYLCIKYFGELISKNKNGGSIVNISSDLGVISPDQRLYEKEGLPKHMQIVKPVSYSVVKSGIIGLTKYIATYWADKKVRCNVICPGGINNKQSKNFLKKVNFRIPMGRLANANEYQGTLLWMLSDASSYLNGAIVTVDGGRSTW